MNYEVNKELVTRYYQEVLTNRNFQVFSAIFASGFTAHGPSGVTANLPEYLDAIKASHKAYPDLRVNIEDQIAEGDRVVTRWMAQGTHQGTYFGIPATGKEVSIAAIHIHRVENGQLAELWEQINIFGALQQLGAIPK
ncbi:MAG TPA: ester cyclase [Bacillota bacterium]|nr:ester cyclase [Bacillota bacterium]